jgi:hypothetical protein
MSDKVWTMKAVALEIKFAAEVMKRLPPVKVQGYHNTWPPILLDFYEMITGEPRLKVIPPNTEEITRMERVIFEWIRILDADETKLVWARAEGVRWKVLTTRFCCHRSTLNEKYNLALAKIAGKLNG